MDNFKYVQAQPFALTGAGASLGATSITLQTFKQIDGSTLITMTDFGSIGFGTLEPGSGTLEEQISFTGVTQNANGTATLTGVSSVGFNAPYTATSGLAKTHAGLTPFVISNTSGFYDHLSGKADDETISGLWDFPSGANNPTIGNSTYVAPTLDTQIATKKYVDTTAVAGAPNATTAVKGIVQIATQAQKDAKTATGSTGASLSITPDTQRSTLTSDYVADTGAANAYVITPSPVISGYLAGQVFSFKASATNTTASTLNVNGAGATAIKNKDGATALIAGDIVAGQVVTVEHDGTNFQMISPSANTLTASPAISTLSMAALLAGEALTAGQAVAAGFYQADGGVKFDSNKGGLGAANSISDTITVANNPNRIAVIVIQSFDSAVSGVPTLNGGNFTVIDSQDVANSHTWVGYVVNPNAGALTIGVTFGGSTWYAFTCYSYYGAKQTGQPEAHVLHADFGSAATGSQALTPSSSGTLLFGYYAASGTNPYAVMTGAMNNALSKNVGGTQVCVIAGDNGQDPNITAQTISFSSASSVAKEYLGCLTIAPATAPSYGYALIASAQDKGSYTQPLSLTTRLNFLGFVTNSPTATQSATVQVAGVVTGLSGLTPTKIYYLSDTPGAVSATAGTTTRKVGIALTTTSLLITNVP